MKFKLSFCDPFQKEITELGEITSNEVIESFQKIPWTDFLKRMEMVPPSDIHYSPSYEIKNMDNNNGLSISAVGSLADFEFYIFYKRPKLVKKFFGLIKAMNNEYLTDITGQTEKDALDCLNALRTNDLDFLENKVK